MGRYGKGITLALFFTFVFCQTREALSQSTAPGFPSILRMDRRDNAYRQFISDVEANRSLVFNMSKGHGINAQAVAEVLTIYSYTVREGDDILSIAARSNISYSSLASLNRLSGVSELRPGMTILLPSAYGLFVPDTPESDLERLLASDGRGTQENRMFPVSIQGSGRQAVAFSFFPGEDFSQTERAFFLNPGIFRFPLQSFRVTSNYGTRNSPINGNVQFHGGLDLAAPAGTDIFASASGTVVFAGYDSLLGNCVRISHSGNWTSTYGHMEKIGVSEGQEVARGAVIGWVGTTGVSTGPHLHFELRQGGQPHDPAQYLRQ